MILRRQYVVVGPIGVSWTDDLGRHGLSLQIGHKTLCYWGFR